MLAAVVCFVSVLCTASLASFGMDAAAIANRSEAAGDSEDIVRVSDNRCLLFHEFFAAVAILVAILYYAIVKLTLMAMGAVTMRPPIPHPLYDDSSNDDSDNEKDCTTSSRQHMAMSDAANNGKSGDLSDSSNSTLSSLSPSSSSSSGSSSSSSDHDDAAGEKAVDETEFGPYLEPNAASAEGCQLPVAQLEMATSLKESPSSASLFVAQLEMPASLEQSPSPSASLLDRSREAPSPDSMCEIEVHAAPRRDERKRADRTTRTIDPYYRHTQGSNGRGGRSERFNAVKIWTNIYGLSIGIYCLVYSLLMPNELSAYVFCVASLLAGVHETLIPCMRQYLLEEEYEMVGNAANTTTKFRRAAASRGGLLVNRRAVVKRQFKRCLGWLCLFQSSVTSEISEAAAQSIRGTRVGRRARRRRDALLLQGADVNNINNRRRGCLQRCLLCAIPCCRDALLDLRDCMLCCLCPCGKGWVTTKRKRSSSFICSGVFAMPSIILLIATGLACKALQDVYFKDAMLHEISSVSRSSQQGFDRGTRYSDHYRYDWDRRYVLYGNDTLITTPNQTWAGKNATAENSSTQWTGFDVIVPTIIMPVPEDPDIEITDTQPSLPAAPPSTAADEPKTAVYGFTDAGSIAVNILFPIIGVLMLKSMRKAEDVRETIELTVPVCGLNSMCIACVIMIKAPACLLRHMSSAIIELGGGVGSYAGAAAAAFYEASSAAAMMSNNMTSDGTEGGVHSPETPMVLMRYQPILAALVLPFPLVCSIVSIVSAGRNHRFMVSEIQNCVRVRCV